MSRISEFYLHYHATVCCNDFDGNAYLREIAALVQNEVRAAGYLIPHLKLLAWEADEVCIITLYAMYIPMFIHIMIHKDSFSALYRYILPLLSIGASLFMCYCSYVSYGIQILYYLIFYGAVMAVGFLFMAGKSY